jgi:membrane protein
MLAAAVAYYLLPDVKQKWRYVTPGSVTATVLWLLVTWGFTFYVENFGSYDATYGSIGAVMVLLAWLYLTALSLVVGGAINAVLEQASVEGKAPGARAPGEAPPPREERAKAAPPGAAKSRSAAVRSGPPADPGLH